MTIVFRTPAYVDDEVDRRWGKKDLGNEDDEVTREEEEIAVVSTTGGRDDAATAKRSNKVDDRTLSDGVEWIGEVVAVVVCFKVTLGAVLLGSSFGSLVVVEGCNTASSRAKSVAWTARRCVSLLVEGWSTSLVVSLIMIHHRRGSLPPTSSLSQSFSRLSSDGNFSHLAAPLFQPASPQGQRAASNFLTKRGDIACIAFSALFLHRRWGCPHTDPHSASRFLDIFWVFLGLSAHF